MPWIFLLGFCFALQAKQLDMNVSAKSAILMNADTGAILFEKEAHSPSFPASTTKIATALFALDEMKIDLNKNVTVSHECLKMKSLKSNKNEPSYWMESDGTVMGLMRGEILSYDDLLHGLMLVSGNDAANAIAESLCGSIPVFVEKLNLYVEKLGCKNTRFCNPHGLHHLEHVTTPFDMALITKKALQIPKFRSLVATTKHLLPKTNKQAARELKAFNPQLRPGRHYYQKAIGVKTGYTAAARNCLVAAAVHEGRTLIAVLFGSEKRGDRYDDAKRLFEAAFSQEKMTRRFLGPENLFTKQVSYSKSPLKAILTKELSMAYFPAEEPECKAFVRWSAIPPPIAKGQKVGEVHIVNEKGELLQKGDLVALEESRRTWIYALREFFCQLSPEGK